MVTPSIRYQTWRGFGAESPKKMFAVSAGTCPTISDANYATALGYLVDEGVTHGRVNLAQSGGLEAAGNDNSDPFTFSDPTNLTPFSTTLVANFNAGSGCLDSFASWASRAQQFRNAVLAKAWLPDMELSFFFYKLSNMPMWWQTGALNSSGCGVDEAAEAFHAVLLWTEQNYFPFDYVTWNEPATADAMFQAEPNTYTGINCQSKAADWYGGWINSLYQRLNSAGIAAKIAGPTPANGGDTQGDLNAINAVAGAEAHLSRISYHGYGLPSTTEMASIYNRAHANSQEVQMDEIFYPGIDGSYQTAVAELAGDIFNELTLGNISVWAFNNMWGRCPTAGNPNNSCSGGDVGISWEPDASNFQLLPRYYVFRQLFKYIVGLVRISASTSDARVLATAWTRSNGGLVVNLINNSGSPRSVTVMGLNNAPYTIHKLDASMCTGGGQFRCAPDDGTTVSASAGSLTLSLTAGSDWTLEQQ